MLKSNLLVRETVTKASPTPL